MLLYKRDHNIELHRDRVILLQSSVTGDILYVPPSCFSRIVYCSIEPIQIDYPSPPSRKRPIRGLNSCNCTPHMFLAEGNSTQKSQYGRRVDPSVENQLSVWEWGACEPGTMISGKVNKVRSKCRTLGGQFRSSFNYSIICVIMKDLSFCEMAVVFCHPHVLALQWIGFVSFFLA